MKPFMGFSNMLGPLGFLGRQIYEPSFHMAQIFRGYTHKNRGSPILNVASPFCAIKVTSNKLEKVLLLNLNQSHVTLTVAL
jgi:hypothetical protein